MCGTAVGLEFFLFGNFELNVLRLFFRFFFGGRVFSLFTFYFSASNEVFHHSETEQIESESENCQFNVCLEPSVANSIPASLRNSKQFNDSEWGGDCLFLVLSILISKLARDGDLNGNVKYQNGTKTKLL